MVWQRTDTISTRNGYDIILIFVLNFHFSGGKLILCLFFDKTPKPKSAAIDARSSKEHGPALLEFEKSQAIEQRRDGFQWKSLKYRHMLALRHIL
jgi:hypothetical protein